MKYEYAQFECHAGDVAYEMREQAQWNSDGWEIITILPCLIKDFEHKVFVYLRRQKT